MGSLYAAVASYLDARAAHGRWLLRIEDLDRPRVIAGATRDILRTLSGFGFEWDGAVVRQSEHLERYRAALEQLRGRGLTFECSCSRAQRHAVHGEESRYPGVCREGALQPHTGTATRLRVEPGIVLFHDRIQGTFRQDVAAAVGDIVLVRRDRIPAYVLAAVVDDAEYGVTHVVRGADLLDNTPRQIYLQRALRVGTPTYAHIPVLTEHNGGKLAKSARSTRIGEEPPLAQLFAALELLGMKPPRELAGGALADAWSWAFESWSIGTLSRRLTLPI